jgi:hypothetical protein
MLTAILAAVTPPPPVDWVDIGSQVIAAVTPVAVFLAVWGFKFLWSKVPASVIVFSAPILGYLLNYALSYVSGLAPASPLIALLLGALAIALREIITTLGAKGLTDPVSRTKAMV